MKTPVINTTAQCTICASEPSPGFYTGCLIADGHGDGRWECDGKGRLMAKRARTCRKCGAFEQEREVVDREFRWRKEGPPPGGGWVGPIYPHAELQIYERPRRERFFDCKFECPNQTALTSGDHGD